MLIEYKPIRKKNNPISRRQAKAFYASIGHIDCGYLEVLEKYGPGVVARGTRILHPREIKEVTAEARDFFRPDANIPPEVDPGWMDSAVVLGDGPERRKLLFTPTCPKSLLIYDGEFDKIYVNKWGFCDPRFGFHGKDFFHGRDFDLIFDSGLNCGSMQAVRKKDKYISTTEAAGDAVSRWFVPGDSIIGDLQEVGNTSLYLSGLGGEVQITTEEIHVVVDMLTISYDLSERKNVESYMAKFGKCGYKIYDFDAEREIGN